MLRLSHRFRVFCFVFANPLTFLFEICHIVLPGIIAQFLSTSPTVSAAILKRCFEVFCAIFAGIFALLFWICRMTFVL